MNHETIPISEVIRLNDNWFSEDSKRFFRSRWDNYAFRNKESMFAYFISSEKHVSYFANIDEPRKYTIRKINMITGDFSNDDGIFKFQAYPTRRKALSGLKKYLETEPIKADKIAYLKSAIEHSKYNTDFEKLQTVRLEKELKELEV